MSSLERISNKYFLKFGNNCRNYFILNLVCKFYSTIFDIDKFDDINHSNLIIKSIALNNFLLTKALINNTYDIHKKDISDRGYLFYSIFYNNFEIAYLLIKKGLSLNDVNLFGDNVVWDIYNYCSKLNRRQLDFLVKNNFDFNSKSGNIIKNSFLIVASLRNDIEFVNVLLLQDNLDIDYKNALDISAIKFASELDYLDITKKLLYRGAFIEDINTYKKDGIYKNYSNAIIALVKEFDYITNDIINSLLNNNYDSVYLKNYKNFLLSLDEKIKYKMIKDIDLLNILINRIEYNFQKLLSSNQISMLNPTYINFVKIDIIKFIRTIFNYFNKDNFKYILFNNRKFSDINFII